jgi:hypothetical protein
MERQRHRATSSARPRPRGTRALSRALDAPSSRATRATRAPPPVCAGKDATDVLGGPHQARKVADMPLEAASPTSRWRAAAGARARPPATAKAVRPCKLPSPHGFLQTFEVRAAELGGQGKQPARVVQTCLDGRSSSSRRRQVATRRTTTETTRRMTGGRGRRLGREPQRAAARSWKTITLLNIPDLRTVNV